MWSEDQAREIPLPESIGRKPLLQSIWVNFNRVQDVEVGMAFARSEGANLGLNSLEKVATDKVVGVLHWDSQNNN